MLDSDDVKEPMDLTTNEKLEYETCTSLIKHHETIRMGMLQFFAVFNGALLGFLTFVFNSKDGLNNGIVIVFLGLFAFIVCLVVLNAEIREMSYWTTYIKRARKIEEEINSRNKYTDDKNREGFMDTYRGTYREIVAAKKFLKEKPENGYSKPREANIMWGNLLFRMAGGSRRNALSVFYLIAAGGWLLFFFYGICLIDDILLRIFILIVVLTIVPLYFVTLNSGIRKSDLD